MNPDITEIETTEDESCDMCIRCQSKAALRYALIELGWIDPIDDDLPPPPEMQEDFDSENDMTVTMIVDLFLEELGRLNTPG